MHPRWNDSRDTDLELWSLRLLEVRVDMQELLRHCVCASLICVFEQLGVLNLVDNYAQCASVTRNWKR